MVVVERVAVIDVDGSEVRLLVATSAPDLVVLHEERSRRLADVELYARAGRELGCARVEIVTRRGDDAAALAWHGVVAVARPDDDPVAVIDVGAEVTLVAVGTRDGGPVWTRAFAIGAAAEPAPAAVEWAFACLVAPLPRYALATADSAAALRTPTGELIRGAIERRLVAALEVAPAGLREGAALQLLAEAPAA